MGELGQASGFHGLLGEACGGDQGHHDLADIGQLLDQVVWFGGRDLLGLLDELGLEGLEKRSVVQAMAEHRQALILHHLRQTIPDQLLHPEPHQGDSLNTR